MQKVTIMISTVGWFVDMVAIGFWGFGSIIVHTEDPTSTSWEENIYEREYWEGRPSTDLIQGSILACIGISLFGWLYCRSWWCSGARDLADFYQMEELRSTRHAWVHWRGAWADRMYLRFYKRLRTWVASVMSWRGFTMSTWCKITLSRRMSEVHCYFVPKRTMTRITNGSLKMIRNMF
jgi:hypothetical protein